MRDYDKNVSGRGDQYQYSGQRGRGGRGRGSRRGRFQQHDVYRYASAKPQGASGFQQEPGSYLERGSSIWTRPIQAVHQSGIQGVEGQHKKHAGLLNRVLTKTLDADEEWERVPDTAKERSLKIANALKEQKFLDAWQELILLQLNLLETQPLPRVIWGLAHEAIKQLLASINGLSRSRFYEQAMGQLCLIMVMPTAQLELNYTKAIEGKYHFLGEKLLQDSIAPLIDISIPLFKKEPTAEGMWACEQMSEIYRKWRPVLSEARQNGLALCFSRLFAGEIDKIFTLLYSNEYEKCLSALQPILMLFDLCDHPREYGIESFRSQCLTLLNKSINGTVEFYYRRRPLDAKQAVKLLRNINLSQDFRWQAPGACEGQRGYLADRWPQENFSNLCIQLSACPESDDNSAWMRFIAGRSKNSGRQNFSSKKEITDHINQLMKTGEAITALQLTITFLQDVPQYFDYRDCLYLFRVFDASLHAVAASLLLDASEGIAPERTLRAFLWLMKMLDPWHDAALILQPKARWILERLASLCYENPVAVQLGHIKEISIVEERLAGTLRHFHDNYYCFSGGQLRVIQEDLAQLCTQVSDMTQLAQYLPVELSKAVKFWLGEKYLEKLQAVWSAGVDVQAIAKKQPVSDDLSEPPAEAVATERESGAGDKNNDDKVPEDSQHKVDNERIIKRAEEYLDEGKPGEAVKLLLNSGDYSIESFDDFKDFQELAGSVSIQVFERLGSSPTTMQQVQEFKQLKESCLELLQKFNLQDELGSDLDAIKYPDT